MRATARLTADIRREDILAAAVDEFALNGFAGASCDAIAKRVGISQPYLFKVWGTKSALFLACIDRVFDRIVERFEEAAEGRPATPETLGAVGETYGDLPRSDMLLLLQGFASCADPEVQALVQRRWTGLVGTATRIAGTGGDPVQHFLGVGLLLTVVRAAGLPDDAMMCDGP